MTAPNQTTETAPLARAFTTCSKCGRGLKQTKSVEHGMGPICRARAITAREEKKDERAIAVLPFDPKTADVVCVNNNGKFQTNINQSIVWHSPTGFSWGYGGSGPADFALNILHWFMPPNTKPRTKVAWYEEPRQILVAKDSGVTSYFALNYHQEFKSTFLATMPTQGGRIKGEDIRAWIAAKISEHDREQLTIEDY